MKKEIRLTETDLTNIVKRIISENKEMCCCEWTWEKCEDDGDCYWECTKWGGSKCCENGWPGGKGVKKKDNKKS